jgi:hypothetical protein
LFSFLAKYDTLQQKHPFQLRLNYALKRYSQKEKQVELFHTETATYRRFAPIGGW